MPLLLPLYSCILHVCPSPFSTIAPQNGNRPFTLATPGNYTPRHTDTDQWATAVASMGGKYAVLNVKVRCATMGTRVE